MQRRLVGVGFIARHLLAHLHLPTIEARRRKAAADVALFKIVANRRENDDQTRDRDAEEAAEMRRDHRDDDRADRCEEWDPEPVTLRHRAPRVTARRPPRPADRMAEAERQAAR